MIFLNIFFGGDNPRMGGDMSPPSPPGIYAYDWNWTWTVDVNMEQEQGCKMADDHMYWTDCNLNRRADEGQTGEEDELIMT